MLTLKQFINLRLSGSVSDFAKLDECRRCYPHHFSYLLAISQMELGY